MYAPVYICVSYVSIYPYTYPVTYIYMSHAHICTSNLLNMPDTYPDTDTGVCVCVSVFVALCIYLVIYLLGFAVWLFMHF